MDLRDALGQIEEIRLRLHGSELFRGYRAGPVAFSGLLAGAAALLQPVLIPDPARHLSVYLGLWITVAAISIGTAGVSIVLRDRWAGPSPTRAVTRRAVGQLLPCLVIGGLVTAVIAARQPESAGLLPGLWQLLLGLGLFASARHLPRAAAGVAVFYVGTGLAVLANADRGLSPWAMGLPFGLGQLLAAGVLYWNLERRHAET